MLNRQAIDRIKENYPPGTRLRLNCDMTNEPGMPAGLEGTVDFVDDLGDIFMKWDNNRSLAMIPGEDSFSKIQPQEQETEQTQPEGPEMNM